MSLSRSASRFVLTGGAATLTHLVVAVLVIEMMGLGQTIANGLAFCVATLLSYVLNTCWSFQARMGLETAWRFLAVSFGALLLTLSLAWLVERAHGHYLLGIAVVVLFVPPLSFAAHRLFTYRK